MSRYSPGTKGFLQWVQTRLPRLYSDIKREFQDANQLAGLGLGLVDPTSMATTAPTSSSLSQTFMDIAQVAAQTYLTKTQIDAQKKILNMNLDRAKQGLTPLDINPANYGLPGPSVGVGMTEDTKKFLMFGGLGLAALFLVSQLKPSRR